MSDQRFDTIYKLAQVEAGIFTVVKFEKMEDQQETLVKLLLHFFDSGCMFEQANRIELETLLSRASKYVSAAKTDLIAARKLLDEINTALNRAGEK